ncbi:MAG: elongation factor 4 [Phycisphaerales bacterium]|nr:elongation factor 4 [Phycisphaerales bacterium]
MPHSRKFIRNFSIIAHIDHGKSTLADRLLQATNAVSLREAKEQLLDSMDIERERGITINASAVTVMHHHTPGHSRDVLESDGAIGDNIGTGGDHVRGAGELYMLNFIDTPGHVDFNYEVSRALKACEGALLVVDATQGVQAQTVVNAYLAINENLELIPVVNKIDLPSARPEEVAMEIEQVLGLPAEDCIYVSAKTGQGISELLAAICDKFPPPRDPVVSQTRALIFDAVYDDYRGVIVYCRVMDGPTDSSVRDGAAIRVGDKIRMLGTGRTFQISELGKYTPKPVRVQSLAPGETGYIVAAIRTLKDVRIGDTITLEHDQATEALPGYKPPMQMVFCDFYPSTTGDEKGTDFEELREAMEKLSLNDSSFTFQPVHSDALGFGFRCGFLGLLHMDIVQERLEREGDVEIVQTAPTVSYQILMRGTYAPRKDATSGRDIAVIGEENGRTLVEVHNPADLPDPGSIEQIREPICKVDIILPKQYIGDIMKLCLDRRGTYKSQHFVSDTRDMLSFEIPLAEIIYDFYDRLKGFTSGYGTMDYELIGYNSDDLVKMDILVNGDPVEALSIIVHRAKAEYRGRVLIAKLKEQIPRHQFEIPLQAAIGGKVIARETIKAFRKNVTAKCYGGDVSRKRKLLEKQKEGKKRMKQVGSVDIPQEAFMAVLEQGE